MEAQSEVVTANALENSTSNFYNGSAAFSGDGVCIIELEIVNSSGQVVGVIVLEAEVTAPNKAAGQAACEFVAQFLTDLLNA